MDELQGPLDRLVAAGAPGAAALVRDERGGVRAASGLADLDTGRPMGPELHFRAGSMTKSFVAAGLPSGHGLGVLQHRLHPARPDREGGHRQPARPGAGRCILGPLGLAGTSLPTDAPGIPSPASRGYSLPRGPGGDALDGPLLDFTLQSPSHAWAAGGLVSDLRDLTGFFLALLGGRLLLAEMRATVAVPPGSIPLPFYDRYGLGLLEVQTPAGRLVGNAGGIPGFLNIVLSTQDGRRQLGVMTNLLLAPGPG
jgi:CubicO group peptidase (beta-lactamase class C family)